MESLIDLFKAEPFSKTYTIQGVSVKLKMLNREQYDDVMSKANMGTDDIISKEALIRRPILGYAIQSINDVNIKDIKEVKNIIDESKGVIPLNLAIETALGEFDANFVDVLYSYYNTLLEDNAKHRESLKKD